MNTCKILGIAILWAWTIPSFAQYNSFTVQGSPYNIGTTTPNYGINSISSGVVVTARAPAFVYIDASNRYACAGWFGGSGNVPLSGTTTSVVFTIKQNSGLVWKWTQEYLVVIALDNNTNGAIALSTNASPTWYSNAVVSIWTNNSINLVSKPFRPNKLFSWTINGEKHDATNHYWTKPPNDFYGCYKLPTTVIAAPMTISNTFGRLPLRIISFNYLAVTQTHYSVCLQVWGVRGENIIIQRCTNIVAGAWTNAYSYGSVTAILDTSIETNSFNIVINTTENIEFFRCKPF